LEPTRLLSRAIMSLRRAVHLLLGGIGFLVDYIPNVTRSDVLRIVTRDYSPQNREVVLALLGLDDSSQETAAMSPRVLLAILKLAGGSVDRVREQLDVARTDLRDVIYPAEYPDFWRVGFVGVFPT
jgi:hypothetical protein